MCFSDLVPKVEFEQAIRDVLAREPRLAANADEVARIYRTRHALAVAHSTEIELTRRVQEAIAEVARSGDGTVRAEKVIAEIGGWPRSYAETVYRTNLATAYQAGRFQQAFDPRVAPEMRAFEYQTVGDVDVRDGTDGPENHAAADGLIAGTKDSVWHRASPPCGYNCRCSLRLVGVDELEELGLIRPDGQVQRREPSNFNEFRPHPRFGHSRPDLLVYGS